MNKFTTNYLNKENNAENNIEYLTKLKICTEVKIYICKLNLSFYGFNYENWLKLFRNSLGLLNFFTDNVFNLCSDMQRVILL